MDIHYLLLSAEAALCGSLVLVLFRLRLRIGLAPLYLVVGALQYLQIVLATAVRFEAASGLVVSPASAVLFPVTTFVVLLTYIELDAEETRKLAFGVVISSVVVYAISSVAGLHLALDDGANPLHLPADLVAQSVRVAAARTFALLAGVVGAVVIYEQLTRRFSGSLFLRLWITAVSVMAIDSLLFTTGAFLGRPGFVSLLASGFASKAVGATFYAGLVAAYVRFLETPDKDAETDRAGRGVLHWITYRQRYEEARSLLARDARTGLYSRGYFDENAPKHLAHAIRAQHQLSVVLLDVDRLKETNDRYGHQEGDQLIRYVAEQLHHIVRTSDSASRYGGDEFAVVLTTANAASAQIFAERLLELIATRASDTDPPPPWAPASVSIGIATYPADGQTVPELVASADERLYNGKRAGGGRVVGSVADPGD